MNGKSKVDFDIIKKNNKKITELSGIINDNGAVKIKKFKETPLIQTPTSFTLKINQIKDIMDNHKIHNMEKSNSTKKKTNVIETKKIKSTKSAKKGTDVQEKKKTKSTKSTKKKKDVIETKKPKSTKSTKKKKDVSETKKIKTTKKSRKNNLEK
jgi:hypothetical protein